MTNETSTTNKVKNLSNTKVLSFDIKEPGTKSRAVRFNKSRVVIGAVISADVRASSEGVSPIHAVIEQSSGGEIMIYDLASETGLFVNGKKTVTETLHAGDEITVGRSKIKIHFEDPDRISKQDILGETIGGQKLMIAEGEDLKALLLESESNVVEIFDYRPAQKKALEVILSWYGTILDIEHFVDENDITMGPSRKNHFGVPVPGTAESIILATKMGDAYDLKVMPGMTGVIHKNGKIEKIEKLAGESGGKVLIGPDDFAKVTLGQLDFYLSYTAAPPQLKPNRLFERDLFFLKVFWSSMMLTGLTIVALMKADLPQTIDAEQVPERIATVLYQPERFRPQTIRERSVEEQQPAPQKQTPPPPKKTKIDITPKKTPPKEIPKVLNTGKAPVVQKQPEAKKVAEKAVKPKSTGQATPGQSEAKEGEGARAKGAEGTRGSPKARAANEHQTAANRPSPHGGAGRGSGSSQVPNEGNVDLLKGASSKILDLLGNSAAKLGAGGSKLKGFGGFTTQGSGGLALSGSGSGGGGTADSLGGLSDKGQGGGKVGTGLGASGTGHGIVGGSTRVAIRTGGPEEAVVMGAIDASAVEAALLAHRDEFRLCYEKEINAQNPDLQGRVGTIFVIGASGRVTSAGIQSTSLKNANVERCVVGVIKRIDFPIPNGGGQVQVTYPFKFSPTGN